MARPCTAAVDVRHAPMVMVGTAAAAWVHYMFAGNLVLARQSRYIANVRLAAEPCRSVAETLFQRHRRIECDEDRAFARCARLRLEKRL